jgi:uncharacterized protein YjbI with pentapeptide repeats
MMAVPSRLHKDKNGSMPVRSIQSTPNPSGSNTSNITPPSKNDNRASEGLPVDERSSNKDGTSHRGSREGLDHLEEDYRRELKDLRAQFADTRRSYASKIGVLYPPTIASSIVAFIIVFLLTTYAVPSFQESEQSFNNKIQFSLALSITAGIIPLIISAAVSSLKIEEQNDTLSALSFLIRNKRSDIALLRQRRLIESSKGMRLEDERRRELIRLLKSGKNQDFNKKRTESGYQLSNFKGVDLSKLNLEKVNLENLDLTEADLSFSYIKDSDLTECTLDRANLFAVTIYNTTLHRASLREANLFNAKLENVDLNESYLSDANLASSSVSFVNLVNVDLTNANISHSKLQNVTLANARLQGAILDGTLLRNIVDLPISEEEARNRGAIFE